MRLPRRFVVLCLPIAALALPTPASAAGFKDRVLSSAGAHASPAAKGTTARYPTADGQTIQVTAADPAIAQQYATLVGTFPHGSELSSLKMVVVPAARINRECGGNDGDGILACYSAHDQTMTVPDSQASGSDVTVDYVIA